MGGRVIELGRLWWVGVLCRTGVASSLSQYQRKDQCQALKHDSHVMSSSVVIDEAIDEVLRECPLLERFDDLVDLVDLVDCDVVECVVEAVECVDPVVISVWCT